MVRLGAVHGSVARSGGARAEVLAKCRQRRRRHAAQKGLGNPRFFLILFGFWAWFGLRVLGHT